MVLMSRCPICRLSSCTIPCDNCSGFTIPLSKKRARRKAKQAIRKELDE